MKKKKRRIVKERENKIRKDKHLLHFASSTKPVGRLFFALTTDTVCVCVCKMLFPKHL